MIFAGTTSAYLATKSEVLARVHHDYTDRVMQRYYGHLPDPTRFSSDAERWKTFRITALEDVAGPAAWSTIFLGAFAATQLGPLDGPIAAIAFGLATATTHTAALSATRAFDYVAALRHALKHPAATPTHPEGPL